jgi:hypothetical protein
VRAGDIRPGEIYAATGQGIQIAKVRVRTQIMDRKALFRCEVLQGLVYVGWQQKHGKLDMSYVGVGEEAILTARDILRPWRVEMERKVHIYTQREAINTALAEMDALLNDLDMPDVQITHLQLPDGYTAVAVLTLDDIRRLHDTRTTDIQTVAGVPEPPTAGTETGPTFPQPTAE